MNAVSGFLCVDKPVGISSFGVVAAVRRASGCRKAGHAGTLDPQASGLLVLALGDATRLLQYLPLEPKQYLFTAQFGMMTDTLDTQGTVIMSGGPIPSRTDLEAALAKFHGSITQVPPAFSAVKVGGTRAYRLARDGAPVDLSARIVTLHSLRLIAYDEALGRADFEVSCSGGTYVRSLARDIAAAVGTCGFASSIRRVKTGAFTVDTAVSLEALEQRMPPLIPVTEALQGLPQLAVDRNQAALLRTGRRISALCPERNGRGPDVVFAFDAQRALVAVLRPAGDGLFQPEKVF